MTANPHTTPAAKRETAAQAYTRLHTEATRRLQLLQAALAAEATGPDAGRDWCDVGDMAEVVEYLGHAGHWAQVPELTEV